MVFSSYVVNRTLKDPKNKELVLKGTCSPCSTYVEIERSRFILVDTSNGLVAECEPYRLKNYNKILPFEVVLNP